MDERRGVIRDELLIKIYILFVLSEFKKSMPLELLTDVVLERVSNYFEFITSLGDLALRGLIGHNGSYWITDKGRETLVSVESSIPYSTRLHTKESIEKLHLRLERDEAIFSKIEKSGSGFKVTLCLDTDIGRSMHVELLAPNEPTAKLIEQNYLKNAEKFYRAMLDVLTKQ